MSFPVPQCVQDHPAFQPGISRSEAEFILALPGRKFVLRVNSEQTRLVVTCIQPSGSIAHTEIDVDDSGQVRTGDQVFPSIDAFVVWLRSRRDDSVWPFPPVAELRRIPELANAVFDAQMSKSEMRQLLANMPFLMFPSSKRRAWVVSRMQPGSKQLAHLYVQPTPSGQGFVIENKSDVVFGSLVGLLQSIDLVPRVAPSSRPLYGSLSDVSRTAYGRLSDVPQPQLPGIASASTIYENADAFSQQQSTSTLYDDPSVLQN